MRLCIVGTGYVGLVTAACFAEMGNRVTCVDIDPGVVERLRAGKIHIYEPGLEALVSRNSREGRLSFTTSLSEGLKSAEVLFNCVGTPPLPDGSCDLTAVLRVADETAELLENSLIFVNKSTVPVGTAAMVTGRIKDVMSRCGKAHEVFVVSNPEFLKEGDAVNDFMKPDRIIIGTTDSRTRKRMAKLYAPFARSRDKIIFMDEKSAEMTKYAANCMLAAKISFINEIANICERVGADVAHVRNGIGADHRIGYHFIYPGVGYGGSCFPKDVAALIRLAQQNKYSPELLCAVDGVNQRQKKVLAQKVMKYFDTRGGVDGKTLAMWGLAFKANTDDVRFSAALDIIEVLTAKGMKIRAYDPAAALKAAEAIGENPYVSIEDSQYGVLDGADALAVVTDWFQFRNPDFAAIKDSLKTPVIFDGRNLYDTETLRSFGFHAFRIGRPDVVPE